MQGASRTSKATLDKVNLPPFSIDASSTTQSQFVGKLSEMS
jgi:hypothetical protein